MWYALVENSIDYYKEYRLFFGSEMETVADKLLQLCDNAMQFDLEEMTMDDINGYYTEGYEDYERLEDAPDAAVISAFRFQCNDSEVRVLSLTESYEGFRLAYESCIRGKLKSWRPVDGLEGDMMMLQKLDQELKALSDGEMPEKLECFEAR